MSSATLNSKLKELGVSQVSSPNSVYSQSTRSAGTTGAASGAGSPTLNSKLKELGVSQAPQPAAAPQSQPVTLLPSPLAAAQNQSSKMGLTPNAEQIKAQSQPVALLLSPRTAAQNQANQMGLAPDTEPVKAGTDTFAGGRTSGGGGRSGGSEWEQVNSELVAVHSQLLEAVGSATGSAEDTARVQTLSEQYRALQERRDSIKSEVPQYLKNIGYVAERGAAGVAGAVEGLHNAAVLSRDRRMDDALAAYGLDPEDVPRESYEANKARVRAEAEEALTKSVTQDYLKSIEGRYQPGETARVLGDVAQAVGGMAPSLALNAAVPGAGMALLFGSGVGQGAQEAYQNGATLEQADRFGTASAALEVGTELLFNGLGGLGKGLLDKLPQTLVTKITGKLGATKAAQVFKALADNKLVQALAASMGEGAEEAVSTLLTPYLERAIYNEDAENATAAEVAQSVILGAAVGGVFQGLDAAVGAVRGSELTNAVPNAINNLKNRMENSRLPDGFFDVSLTGSPMADEVAFEDIRRDPSAQAESDPILDPLDISKPVTAVSNLNTGENKTASGVEAEAQSDLLDRWDLSSDIGLEQTGRALGVEENTIAQAKRISEATGKKIRFYRAGATEGGIQNGYYDKDSGTIWVNANSENPLAQSVAHEMTHSVEFAADYRDLSAMVLRKIQQEGGDLDTLRSEKRALYAQNGVELAGEAEVDAEIVADFAAERLLTDEASILELTQESPGLAQKIRNWLDWLLSKLKNVKAKERIFLRNARDTYARALRQSQSGFAADPNAVLQQARNAYVGGEMTEDEYDAALDLVMEEESAAGRSMLDLTEPGKGQQYSFKDKKIPTYDELVAKADIVVVDIRNKAKPDESFKNVRESEEAKILTQTPVVNKDTGETVFITAKTFSHSFSGKGTDKISAVRKIREIVENAVLTHAEPSRNTRSAETGVYTLFGAVRTENGVQPVKVKIKEYAIDGRDIPRNIREQLGAVSEGDYATVYDNRVLVVEEIKKEGADGSVLAALPINGEADRYPSVPSKISIRELLGLVNSEYQKYLPKQTERQYSFSDPQAENGFVEPPMFDREFVELPMFQRVEPVETAEAQGGQAEAAQEAQAKEVTLQEVRALYPKLKEARKAYEKAMARNKLSEEDRKLVGKLMRGDLELGDLKEGRDNVEGITAVYQAKQEYEGYAKTIRAWNGARKQALRDQADKLLTTAITWKDKKAGILYSRETMERNIRDIVPDEQAAEAIIREYFTPVHKAQAASTRTKNAYRERVRALNLSQKAAKGNEVSEAHAVQLLGEAEDNIRMLEQSRGRMKSRDGKTLQEWQAVVADLWAQNPNLDQSKVRGAVEQFRQIYDELFEQMNEARTRNGYEPVNYRSGYFPHFQPGEGDGILGQFGKALGIDTQVAALPTTINGLTHTFKPGIQWFGNAQQRLGFNTAYDAVEGFDKYIEGVSDVIHQTDNIQKLRALAQQIRYRSGDDGIKQQIDEIRAREGLSDEEKNTLIQEVGEKGKYTLGNFVVELEEYTNLLANKKSRSDRDMEQALGRNSYNVVKKLESRVAANMVAINPASWLTNFIPLTQGNALLDRGMLLQGMWDTLKAVKADDGIIGQSTFLTNRQGSDPIVKTWSEEASAALSKPMELIDNFTAGSLVRARYRQNLQKGMSEAAAMEEADSWVAGVMADRSKGSTPTLFNRSNPVTKMFTQFQLEVNNQFSYLFKDIPRDTKEKGLAALAAALLKFALGAFLFNEIYEKLIGRRPALDPIGILNDTVGDLTGYELPNLVDLGVGAVTGDMPSFKTEKKGFGEAVKNTATNVVEELPFVSVANAFGADLDAGRIPVTSAIPDVGNLWDAATNSSWSGKKRLTTAAKELAKPATYLALPFGGGQVKKAVEGVEAVARGGSYSVDKKGNDLLQYPVFSDSAGETVANTARAVLFGKTTLPTGAEWIESGFKTWDAGYTEAYQTMREAGMGERESYELLSAMRAEKKDKDKLGTLAAAELSDELTQKVAGVVMGTELETKSGNRTAYAKLLDAEKELGLTAAEYLAYFHKYGGQAMGEDGLRDAYDLGVGVEDYLKYYTTKEQYDADGNEAYSSAELIDAIESSGMTGDARTAMYMLTFPKWAEKAEKHGVNFDVYVEYKLATNGLEADKDKDGESISGSLKAKVLDAIDGLNISGKEKDALYLAAGYGEKGLKDAPWH